MSRDIKYNTNAFMPEVLLYKVLNNLMDTIYNDNKEKKAKDTLLYNVFANQSIDRFDFYEQSKTLFDKKHEKRLRISIGYNLKMVDSHTCIHVILPNETPKSAPIGGGEGYIDGENNDDGTTYRTNFTYDFSTTYNLLITSPNAFLGVLLYNFLKASFISLNEHFEILGFQNLKIGGGDLDFDDGLVPPHVFHRNFNLFFDYDFSVNSYFAQEIGKKVLIDKINE